MQKRGGFVASSGRSHQQLRRDRTIAGVKGEGGFRRDAPVLAEANTQIAGAKIPKRGVPARRLALALMGISRDVPALHDFLQEAAFEKPFAMSA